MNTRVVVTVIVILALGGVALWQMRPDLIQAGFAKVGGRGATPAPAPGGAAQMPPPEVGIVTVAPADTPLPLEYAGRVAGFRDVEVRPRVSGLLLDRKFDEGARVAAGQTLFQIDPATYEAAVARAEAQLAQAQVSARQAEDNFRRADELLKRGVTTDRQRDDAQAARDQAQASIQVAEAELRTARLNLGYTTVTAPVAGVTALTSPPVGTLIQAQSTLLTTVTQLDPAYVNFSYTDEEGQRVREANARGRKPVTEKDLSAELLTGTGRTYGVRGRIDTAAQRVDPQTGTIQARAIFPNSEGILLPGQFVRVIIHGFVLPQAILVPAQAVTQGAQGASVFVVDEKGSAQPRAIRLGSQLSGRWIVEDGLAAGDRVIVDGLMRVRPGAPVRSVAWTGSAAGAAPSADRAGAAQQGGAKP